MKNSNSSEEVVYKSGNIFGWKISFISLGIILVTLLAVIVSENQKKKMKNQTTETVVDSLEVGKIDSIKILE
ncbi:MAG: hypothetical protein AB8B69_12870 [Chitinophagales bacterium]